MSPTSPPPALATPVGDRGTPPAGEVDSIARPGGNLVAASTSPEVRPGSGPSDSLWFLAECHHCGGDLAQPFRKQAERDQWAIAHLLGTGHAVRLSVDGIDDDLHLAAYLRRTDDAGGFKWLCPAPTCAVRWIGSYDTPQLALADWRGHAGIGRTR